MSGMAEIAKDVGVSISLVSKVLSGRMGKSSVRPDLARKIHVRARELGYVPNSSARALVQGRQHAIGVFISRHGQLGSGLVEAIIDGVATELALTGQRMLLQFFHSEADFEDCLAIAHPNVLDGVLVAGCTYFDATAGYREILRRKVPLATLLDDPVSPEVPNVGISQHAVGRLATHHLIENGCQRIVFLHAGYSVAEQRFQGYRQALADAAIPYAAQRVCRMHSFEAKTVPKRIGMFLESGLHFDGVVTESDLQASMVLRTLWAAGKRVPEDVKVIGVDNSPVCQFGIVPQSSVSGQDFRRARLAVTLLNERIEGLPVRNAVLPPVVMARQSSGADMDNETESERT